MDKKELLEYVRVLRKRQLEDSNRKGMTSWGVLIALVYVFWQLLPQLSSISKQGTDIGFFVMLYGYIHIVIICGYFVLIKSSFLKKKSRFDYRIQGAREDVSYLLVLLLLVVIMVLPACSSYFSIENNVAISDFARIQLQINYWALFFMFVVVVLSVLIVDVYFKFTGFPFPYTLPSNITNNVKVSSLIVTGVACELLIGNLYLFVNEVLWSGKGSVLFLASLNLSIASICLVAYIVCAVDYPVLRRLEDLERDIILHDINDIEIKDRLEEEYIGCILGEWVSRKITHTKEKALALINKLDNIDNLVNEINAIDVEYVIEKRGRLKSYRDDLKKLSTGYLAESGKLVKWLRSVEISPAGREDVYVREVVKNSIHQLDLVNDEIVNKFNSMDKRLDTLRF